MENIQNTEKQDFVVVTMAVDMDSIVDQMSAESSYLERLSEERPPRAVSTDDRALLALLESAVVAHSFSRLYKPSGKVAEFYEHRFLSLVNRIRRILCVPVR